MQKYSPDLTSTCTAGEKPPPASASPEIPTSLKAACLAAYLRAYLHHLSAEGITESTHKHKAKENRLFLEYLDGTGHSMRLEDVTVDHIAAHLEDMKRRGLSPSSIGTRRRALHAWWNWMVRMDIVQVNPVMKIRPPRGQYPVKPFLSSGVLQQILDLCDPDTLTGSRRAAMLMLLATTGIRRRELTLLELRDVDWGQARILVRNGKGQRPRIIPFLALVQEPMRRYLGHREDSLPDLWVTERGKPLRYDGVGQDIARLFRQVGVTVKDPVHIFRRTFARNSLLQQVPRPYIQSVAGWTSGQMLDRYTRAMQDEEASDYFRGMDFDPFVR